eukprot:XP_001708549.1 Hypothetical protein GL50803_4923 [Giardia lamblia ATCC 50803]
MTGQVSGEVVADAPRQKVSRVQHFVAAFAAWKEWLQKE